MLANIYNTLLDANESELQEVVPDPEFFASVDENIAAHRAIVDAIAAGSVEQTRAAIHAHEAFFFVPKADRPIGPARTAARAKKPRRARTLRRAPALAG